MDKFLVQMIRWCNLAEQPTAFWLAKSRRLRWFKSVSRPGPCAFDERITTRNSTIGYFSHFSAKACKMRVQFVRRALKRPEDSRRGAERFEQLDTCLAETFVALQLAIVTWTLAFWRDWKIIYMHWQSRSQFNPISNINNIFQTSNTQSTLISSSFPTNKLSLSLKPFKPHQSQCPPSSISSATPWAPRVASQTRSADKLMLSPKANSEARALPLKTPTTPLSHAPAQRPHKPWCGIENWTSFGRHVATKFSKEGFLKSSRITTSDLRVRDIPISVIQSEHYWGVLGFASMVLFLMDM